MNQYVQNVYIPDWDSKTVIVSSPGAGGHFFSHLIQKYYYKKIPNSSTNIETNDWDSPGNPLVSPVHLEGLFPYKNHPNRLFTKSVYKNILKKLEDKHLIVVMGKQYTPLLDVLAKWKRCHRGKEHWSDSGWRRLHNRARNNFELEVEDFKHNQHYDFFVKQCCNFKNLHVIDYHDLFIQPDLKILNSLHIQDALDEILEYISNNKKIISGLEL